MLTDMREGILYCGSSVLIIQRNPAPSTTVKGCMSLAMKYPTLFLYAFCLDWLVTVRLFNNCGEQKLSCRLSLSPPCAASCLTGMMSSQVSWHVLHSTCTLVSSFLSKPALLVNEKKKLRMPMNQTRHTQTVPRQSTRTVRTFLINCFIPR